MTFFSKYNSCQFIQKNGLIKQALDAIKSADCLALKKLVENESLDVNAFYEGHSLAHWIVLKASFKSPDYAIRCQMLEFLLEKGANPNAYSGKDSTSNNTLRYTALHTSVRRGLLEMVLLLLDYNADPELCDIRNGDKNKTPMQYIEQRLDEANKNIQQDNDIESETLMKNRFENIAEALLKTDTSSNSYEFLCMIL